MKKIFLLFVFILIWNGSFSQENNDAQKSTYFLIRHAEKDRSDTTNKNPSLTEKGQQRALKWSELLVDYGINAVYSTEYNRTQETAKPTADRLNLTIENYHPFKIDFEKFLKDTKGKNVLVVGHSNTVPFFVNKLTGSDTYQQMEDNDNASLYIVTIQGEVISSLVIKTKN